MFSFAPLVKLIPIKQLSNVSESDYSFHVNKMPLEIPF